MEKFDIAKVPPYPLLMSGAVNPQNCLYLPANAFLYVNVWASSANCGVEVHGWMLRPDGTLSQVREDISITNTLQWYAMSLPLGEGFLLGLSAIDHTNYAVQGNVWVTAHIGLAPVSEVFWPITLGFGPMSLVGQLALYPPAGREPLGQITNRTIITGSDPAAGAEIAYTVPTGVRLHLHALRATLVTAAAAATRQVHLQVTDGTNVLVDIPANATEIISLTRAYNFAEFGAAPAATDAQVYGILPAGLVLLPAWQINTVTTAIDAGDNWSAPVLLVDAYPNY